MSNSSYSWTLNSLSSVSLLGVQLLAVNTLPVQAVKHDLTISILRLDERVSSGIKSKVSLVHKLFVER
jgi:hypothetical protein